MTKVTVVESVLNANDAVADLNRRRMNEAGVLGLNVMSAPGSGKTTLLQATIPRLTSDRRVGVLVGDLQTSRDAERLQNATDTVTQINTGRGCHLSAPQVAEGLATLDLSGMGWLFIENVGNLVCPAAFSLGEHKRVVLLSVPEGDDKVAKYPTMFQPADLILLTKVDLLPVLDFEPSRVEDDLARINTRARLLRLSTKDGTGLDEWLAWLREQRLAVVSD